MKIVIAFDPETQHWQFESIRGEETKYFAIYIGSEKLALQRYLSAASGAAGVPQFWLTPATEIRAAA
jgi:hypothetical protein